MITAVDTNILLDVFLPDPKYGEMSLKSLEAAYRDGALVICSVVYAELVPQFNGKRELLDEVLDQTGIEVLSLNRESAFTAGLIWQEYRRKNKKRDRIITDFLIGSFALQQSDRFLTRDRGFYRKYFKDLNVMLDST